MDAYRGEPGRCDRGNGAAASEIGGRREMPAFVLEDQHKEEIVVKSLRPRMPAVVLSVAVAAMTAMATPVHAQTDQASEAARRADQTPLKIQVVLSRYKGDKKISSMPYVLWVTTNEGATSLRMGVQVPIPTTTFGAAASGGVNTIPISSYSMKNVGTNIDCSAKPGVGKDTYLVLLAVEDSSVYTAPPQGQPQQASAPPSLRSFTSTFHILLRDGQTAQYTSATDPVSGEVLKIDATLNVLK
jgi:hypothetical protein